MATLTLFDLSAAFDAVDHKTLLHRLKVSYGVSDMVHGWFISYLSRRSQFVRCGSSSTLPKAVLFGVLQGSVLGPILFLLYTADLLGLVKTHGLRPHLYADDSQIFGSCRPGDTAQLQSRVSAFIDDVGLWMRSNRLQLNMAKTDVLWCASPRREYQIPDDPLRVVSDLVQPVRSVQNLSIHLDSDLSMNTHITRTFSCCFAVLRQIRSISRSVNQPVVQSLIVSLVISRLDSGCATLAGLPACQLDRLQSALNAAVHLIYRSRRFDHVTLLLHDLHELRIPERITFRLAVLANRCQDELAPQCLADDLHRVAEVESRRRLRSAAAAALIVSATARSTIGDRAFCVAAARAWNGLPLSVTSCHQRPFRFSENILRHFYLLAPSHHSNACLRFYIVTLFYSAVFTCVLLCVFYPVFMYHGLFFTFIISINVSFDYTVADFGRSSVVSNYTPFANVLIGNIFVFTFDNVVHNGLPALFNNVPTIPCACMYITSPVLFWIRLPGCVPYRPRRSRSLLSSLIAFLLVTVESNPGPAPIRFGC